MKECKNFQCQYQTDDSRCFIYGSATDCTLRRCYHSCKFCKHTCKNRKRKMNSSKSGSEKSLLPESEDGTIQ